MASSERETIPTLFTAVCISGHVLSRRMQVFAAEEHSKMLHTAVFTATGYALSIQAAIATTEERCARPTTPYHRVPISASFLPQRFCRLCLRSQDNSWRPCHRYTQ